MFWRFGGYANISTLDTILDKPDVTVEELLEESDLIQELKQQNAKLIEFLRGDSVVEKLLHYVVAPKTEEIAEEYNDEELEVKERKGSALDTFFGKARSRSRSKSLSKNEGNEDEESKEEKQRMKYAYVACEILSSEVWSISEAVLENREALRKFWAYMKQPAPLDPLQAGYFTKVNESLLDRKTEEMLAMFKSLDNIVQDMLQHVDCPMVMDLLLKIISLERSEGGQGIVDWLEMQNLVPILLSYLSPEHNSATQTSAGDFLKAIITISANATTQDQNVIGPNELTRQLVSEPCIQVLIKEMLRGGNPLTVGVGIVIEVIRKNNSDYDLENQTGPVPRSSDPIYLGTLLRQFAKSVPDFMHLILDPDHKTIDSDGKVVPRRREMKAASGEKIEPLGFDRFKTCELMAELLHCSNMGLLNERGAEEGVRQRDAEREHLKADGKLRARKDESEHDQSGQDFGTSVDSSGFHHARAPSMSDEAPEDIKRLEVSNAGDDEDFETVARSDALADEIKDELDEALLGEPLDRSPKIQPNTTVSEKDTSNENSTPLEKPAGVNSEAPAHEVPPLKPRRPEETVGSPTSNNLAEKVKGLEIQRDPENPADDTLQKEDENAQPKTPTSPTSSYSRHLTHAAEITASPKELSPHPEDKPAPLFAKKSAQADEDSDASVTAATGDSETTDLTEAPRTDESESNQSVLANNEEAYNSTYVVDIDGSPVVGDLLKMMFVEHHVVPTILDFFFRFPWNNFLHNVVYDVVQQVFNGTMERGYNRQLAIDLFETGRITDRIIEGQRRSDESQAKNNTRLGYMGHLTLIAEEVVKFTERHPPELLAHSVLERVMSQSWIDYVEHTLTETRERDNAILGGVRPDMAGMGPRQAVLNAVNAAQGGFGGDATSSLMSGGAAGNGGMPLDSMEITNQTSSGGYLFGSGGAAGSGGGLLSGFNNSSDEEDDEIEDAVEREERHGGAAGLTDDDQVGELSFEDVDMGY
ncbi:SAPS-domain-containing protein [Rhizodiscina lignyota]|uniref:SAPS-domain-containing protein n=1 Tax=Rhizodiscina lignyota TaxID=1504668 RepID=A0A9P4MEB7_9PEZI|nr:SAPS-domain-containing protein [Rhizodiscina lignyota]